MNANTYPRARTLANRFTYSSFELALVLTQHDNWQVWPAAYHAHDALPTWHGDMGRRVALDVPHAVYHGNGRVERVEGITAAALARQLDRWAGEARRHGGYLIVPVCSGERHVGSFLIHLGSEGDLLWHAEWRAGEMQRRSA